MLWRNSLKQNGIKNLRNSVGIDIRNHPLFYTQYIDRDTDSGLCLDGVLADTVEGLNPQILLEPTKLVPPVIGSYRGAYRTSIKVIPYLECSNQDKLTRLTSR